MDKKGKVKKFLIILLIICITIVILFIIKKGNLKEQKVNNSRINNINENINKISSYNNPIIPEGFKKVETNTASWELENGIPKGWDSGLVIEDNVGNQFVWVPLDINNTNYEKLEKEFGYVYDKDLIDKNKKEDLQILKYEGFYIARYEAGIPDNLIEDEKQISEKTNNIEGIPVSKKNQIVWNYIDWNTACENSEKMYQTESVESGLITAKQWGTIIKWLENNNYDVKNSKKWGNYSDTNFKFNGYYSIDKGRTYNYDKDKMKQTYNMILSTGASERNKTNNIYDLAGNIAEFTGINKLYIDGKEIGSGSYMARGGYYDNSSVLSIDSSIDIAEPNDRQGFRVVLYIK